MTEKNYTIERDFQLNPDRAINMLRVYRDQQAWLNAIYLLLTFPLGIAFFVFLVAGVSLGAGMAITLIGIPILLGVFLLSGYLVRLDAWLANTMLGTNLNTAPFAQIDPDADIMTRIGTTLKDGNRWKGIGYLFLRFPMGIGAFVATVTLLSLSLGMITAPFTYMSGELEIAFWYVNTFGEAVLASFLGVFVGAAALHMLKGVSTLWSRIQSAILTSEKRKAKNDEL